MWIIQLKKVPIQGSGMYMPLEIEQTKKNREIVNVERAAEGIMITTDKSKKRIVTRNLS